MNDSEPHTMRELESYSAISVHKYSEGPIEEIAVHYVRINKIVENKQPRKKDLIEVQRFIEDDRIQGVPNDHRTWQRKTQTDRDSF